MADMTRDKALEVLEKLYRDSVRDAEMYRLEILEHPNANDSLLLLHGVCQEEAEVMAYAIAAIRREKEIVHCKDCCFWKPAHVLKDGKEYSYDEMPPEAYGTICDGFVTQEYGTNVGAKCMRDCNVGYAEDKSVFRGANDYCSLGKRKEAEHGQTD